MIGAFSVLRYRDYTVYAAARFCSFLAWEMLGVAIGLRFVLNRPV